jgi:uncharacterized protein
MNSNITKKSTILIGIFFTILLLLATLLLSPFFGKLKISKTEVFFASRVVIWLTLLLVAVFCFKIEKQKMLLWTENKFSLGEYVKSFFGIIGSIILGALIIGLTLKATGYKTESDKLVEILKIFKNNYLLLIFTCLTAGITEELIFRGYLMPRLQLFFNNNYLSITISSVLFGLMHFGYGTLVQIIGPIFIGAVFAIHYQKYRNIKILIFCHFFWDFMMLTLKV